MILKKMTEAGINWVQSNKKNEYWYSLCVTPTGRIIAGSTNSSYVGIWYSDDNGINWVQSNKKNAYWYSLCVTPTGRIIAGNSLNYDSGIWYSDDNGIKWVKSNAKDFEVSSLCITPTGRIIAGSGSGIWYSDPEHTAVCTKYLDQNGAQEMVTQFKAYCDSLVGGV